MRSNPDAGTQPARGLMAAGQRLGTLGLMGALAAGVLVWASPALAATVPSTQRLQASLLTVQNLPTGWAKASATSPTTTSCYSNPIWKVPYTAKARAAFQMNDSVPQLVELLASYPNAHSAYLQVVANLNHCSRFSETVQGQKITGTLSPVSNRRFGNESSSFTANLTVQGTVLSQEIVIARKGGTLAAVAVGDYGTIDTPLLNGLTTKAVRLIPA